MKFLRRDANDRVLNAVKILCFADDFRVALVTVLPGLVTDHCDRMRVSPLAFFRFEAASHNRTHAKGIEIVRRNDSADRALRPVANAERRAHDLIDNERFKQRRIFFEIEKVWIRKRSALLRAARCADEREHPVLMRHERVRANQNSFDPTKYGGVCADPQSQAKDRQDGKAGTASKHSESKPKVLQKRLHLSLR